MKQIELTKEQISYLSTYLEEEIDRTGAVRDMGTAVAVGLWSEVDVHHWIENAISAFNGGAR